jgi:hypothetical protein
MVGSESEFLFRIRVRILQKNSDYFGFGSTTLGLTMKRKHFLKFSDCLFKSCGASVNPSLARSKNRCILCSDRRQINSAAGHGGS